MMRQKNYIRRRQPDPSSMPLTEGKRLGNWQQWLSCRFAFCIRVNERLGLTALSIDKFQETRDEL